MSRSTVGLLSASFVAMMFALLFVDSEAAGQDSVGKDKEVAEEGNPYLAAKGLSVDELADYLERMLEKPKTIRRRRAFSDAVVEAAERMLKAVPKDKPRKLAALTLFDTLHKAAVIDDKEADVKLMKWAEKFKKDPIKEIAAAADLHLWEKRVMDARKDKLAEEKADKLLADLKTYLAKETLTQRHLRLCSEAIGVINDAVKDKKKAGKLFDEFGQIFVKSKDKDLARYGKAILKKPKKKRKGKRAGGKKGVPQRS